MLLDELHEFFGSWSQMNRELLLGATTYQRWRKIGYIPFQAQLRIQEISKNRFQADRRHGEPDKKANRL